MNEIVPARNGYEEGLEAGKKVAGNWQPARLTLPEKWREAALEAPNASHGMRDEKQVLADLERWSREDLLAYATEEHRRKMDAFPGLERFPELAGWDQYLDEYPRGYADGAGIDMREVHLNTYWTEMFFRALGGGSLKIRPRSCSECFIPKTPNGPLLGIGRDDIMAWYTDEPFGVSWPGPVRQQEPLTKTPEPDTGVVLATGGGAMYEYEEEREEAIFPAPALSFATRYCTTTLEAVELLIRYNDYWGPSCNCVVGDAEGNGALFEKSKYHYAVRMSDRNLVISTWGGCDDEDMRRMCDLTNPLIKYYDRRLGVMKEILAEAEAGDGIDGEVFWKAMLHHDKEAPGCQHRDTMPPGVELFTHTASYWLPAEGRGFGRVIARDNGKVLYPCSVPVIESR